MMSTVEVVLSMGLALLLIQTKHLIVDWMWQPAYEHQNKGTYGHFGGIRHAGKNAIGTSLVIWLVFPVSGLFVLAVALFDFVVHYHIDWTKKRIVARTGWGANTHCQFWWITGADQWAHQITYAGILVVAAIVAFG